MNMKLPRIDKKGRVTIPNDVREAMGISEGDRLMVSTGWKGYLLTKIGSDD